jgi:hypothetical protein
VYIIASILCVLIAAALAFVFIDGWETMPGWVSGLALVTTCLMLVSAARVYAMGVRRKRLAEGPRTKIVLADVPPPPRSNGRRTGD